jgi:hypothetical protein
VLNCTEVKGGCQNAEVDLVTQPVVGFACARVFCGEVEVPLNVTMTGRSLVSFTDSSRCRPSTGVQDAGLAPDTRQCLRLEAKCCLQ